MIDSKGDRLLVDARVRSRARRTEGGRRARRSTTRSCTAPTPSSPTRSWGGEAYSEPQYLSQAQRYLGHGVRVLTASGRRSPVDGEAIDATVVRRWPETFEG